MSVEMVQAIGGLWLLATPLALVVAMLLFRAPLRSVLNRAARIIVRRGDTEVTVEAGSDAPDPILVESLAALAAAQESPDGPGEPLEEDKEGDPWADTLYAYWARDMSKMEEAFGRIQKGELDPDALARLSARYQYFRYSLGDASALASLATMAATPGALRAAKRAIGMCYDSGSQYDRAASAYEEAAEASETEVGRAEMIVALAMSLSKSTHPTGATDRILTELDREPESAARVELLKGLANIYNGTGDDLLQALALELALSYEPNDADTQFAAAYAYSRSSVPLASLFHYDLLLGFSPDYGHALNNQGVVYSRLGLPIRAIGAFESASQHGNTLASANLANRLVEIGMTSSAEELLKAARANENVHRNVWAATEALEKAQTEESDKHKKFVTEAGGQREFLLAYGGATFIPPHKQVPFDGRWSVAGGVPFGIASSDSKLTAKWTDDDTVFFEGSILGNGVSLQTKSRTFGAPALEQPRIPDSEGTALYDTQGLAFVSAESEELRLMTWRSGEIGFVTFSR